MRSRRYSGDGHNAVRILLRAPGAGVVVNYKDPHATSGNVYRAFGTGDGVSVAFSLPFVPKVPLIYGNAVLLTINTQYTCAPNGNVTMALSPPAAAPGATPSTTGGSLATATYYYKISALNASGESVGSAEASAAVTGPTGSVALTWSAVTGATSYRVYRGTAAGVQNVYYATANVTTYTDTGAASTAGSPLTTPTGTQPTATNVLLTWTGNMGATP